MEDAKTYYSPKRMKEQGMSKYFQMQTDGSLQIKSGQEEAFYVSDVIDSYQVQMEWDSMHLQVSGQANIEVYVWLQDDEAIISNWKKLSFDDRYYVLVVEGRKCVHTDILLYEQANARKGRFLCFAVHCYKSMQKDFCWHGYEIRFPKVCFSTYLPAIYHGNATLNRYLAIFKELYLEMERVIDTFDQELNPWQTTKLNEVSEWLNLEIYMQDLEDHKKRAFFKFYRHLRQRKGTMLYFQEMLNFLFDEQAQCDVAGNKLSVVITKKKAQIQEFLERELPCYMVFEIHEKTKIMHAAVIDSDILQHENVML